MIEVNISNDGPSQIILNWEESDHPQFQGVQISAVPPLPSGVTTNFSKGTTNATINFPKGSLASNQYVLTLTVPYQGFASQSTTLEPVEIHDYQFEVAEYDSSKTKYDSLFDFASGYVDANKTNLSLSDGFILGQWASRGNNRVRVTNFSYDIDSDTLTVQAEAQNNGSQTTIVWIIYPFGIEERQKILITTPDPNTNNNVPGVTVSSGNRNTLTISNYLSLEADYSRLGKRHRLEVIAVATPQPNTLLFYDVLLVKNGQSVCFSNSFSSTGVQIDTASGMLRPSGDPSGDQNQRLDFEGTNVHRLLIHRLLDGVVDDTFYIKVNVTDVAGQ